MNMKTFNEPAIEVVKMNVEDVLTTSPTGSGNGDNNTGDQEL